MARGRRFLKASRVPLHGVPILLWVHAIEHVADLVVSVVARGEAAGVPVRERESVCECEYIYIYVCVCMRMCVFVRLCG